MSSSGPNGYLSKKALAALAALAALGNDGYCDARQSELAEEAGMSERHFRRAIRELESAGRVMTTQTYLARYRKSMNTYKVIHRTGQKESDHSRLIGQKESDHSRLIGQKESDHSRLIGQKESGIGGQKESGMNHGLIDSCINNKQKIIELLSFIAKTTLLRGTKTKPALVDLDHMTVELAQNANTWYYGGYDGPYGPIPEQGRAGYAVSCLRNGDFLPLNKQMELPAGVAALAPEEIEALEENPPVEGATLGEDGQWR